MLFDKKQEKEVIIKRNKLPFVRSDFEAVLSAATKPLKKQGEKESEETSESRRSDVST